MTKIFLEPGTSLRTLPSLLMFVTPERPATGDVGAGRRATGLSLPTRGI
ncbi:MAG: hypothetical protein IIC29_07735 [Chloroflexi bacterium]|nr:hypothetical protein [Chloroflexota bacterium]MCH8236001.1 hypothetical protein [Chloroflexota bacterium]MCH8816287.1 hypothetical protein [Chloroflexota bacterium]